MVKPSKRQGYWYLVRRVPKAVAHLDTRVNVRVSTKIKITDDPRGVAAGTAVARINAALEADWRALLDGKPLDEINALNAAKAITRRLGFDYAPIAALSERNVDELLARIEALESGRMMDTPDAVEAVLGGIDVVPPKVSEFTPAFEEHEKSGLASMSPRQLKKWRNPKLRAANLFIQVAGDLQMDKITRNDALDFRAHWQMRLEDEGLDIGTANKDFGHMNKMFTTLNDAMRLDLQSPFANLRISGQEEGQRTAYPPEFVQNNILKEGILDALNEEARRIVYVMADTGLRLAEACNLMPEDIHLDAPVPYVSVAAHGRRLKTKHSAREIPLVGVSLAALKAQPLGFPRYHDNASSLSSLVNKVFIARNLRPLPMQSLYSLRHTFEDRLIAAEVPEKIIAMLMGHKFSRPKYGAGPSLAQKRKWLLKIAFRPPSKV